MQENNIDDKNVPLLDLITVQQSEDNINKQNNSIK